MQLLKELFINWGFSEKLSATIKNWKKHITSTMKQFDRVYQGWFVWDFADGLLGGKLWDNSIRAH